MAKELKIERSSKDYYKRQNVKITINKEEVEIPIKILEDFVRNKNIKESFVPIPD